MTVPLPPEAAPTVLPPRSCPRSRGHPATALSQRCVVTPRVPQVRPTPARPHRAPCRLAPPSRVAAPSQLCYEGTSVMPSVEAGMWFNALLSQRGQRGLGVLLFLFFERPCFWG